MTRAEAIAAAPARRWEYWLNLSLCTLFAIGIVGSILFLHQTASIRVASIVFACLVAGLAWQSAQRLFAPVQAARRSASISELWKSRIRTLRSLCLFAFIILFCAGFILSTTNHDLGSNLKMIAWLVFLVGPALSEIIGERSYAPIKIRPDKHHIAWKEFHPIASDHWGER